MILWNRRSAWLTVCLAGLEMTVLTSVLLFLYRGSAGFPAWAVMVTLWGLQCLWIVVVDLLSSMNLDDAAYRWRAFIAVFVSSLLLVRSVAYPEIPIGDLSWLPSAWEGLFALDTGLPLELLTVLTNLALWVRALQANSWRKPFSRVAGAVRWRWTLAAVASLGSATISQIEPVSVLVIGFPLGLVVLLIARAQEKAANTSSAGLALSLPGLLQFALVILTVVGAGILPLLATTDFLVPWLEKGFSLGMLLLLQVVMLFVFLVYPTILRAIEFVAGSLGSREVGALISLPSQAELLEGEAPIINAIASLPLWLITLMRVAALLLLVAMAAGLVILVRRVIRPQRRRDNLEQRSRRAAASDAMLRRGLSRLQDMLDMARRIGVGQQLLAAISVQNIYANLSRLARARDHPRKPYQAPDHYLQDMVVALGGYEEPLQRITGAYMRVHYGDHDIGRDELRRIQSDYRLIRDEVS